MSDHDHDHEVVETRSLIFRTVNRYPALTHKILAGVLGLALAGGGWWLKAAYGEFKATTAEMRSMKSEQEQLKAEQDRIGKDIDRRLNEIHTYAAETRTDVREIRQGMVDLLRQMAADGRPSRAAREAWTIDDLKVPAHRGDAGAFPAPGQRRSPPGGPTQSP